MTDSNEENKKLYANLLIELTEVNAGIATLIKLQAETIARVSGEGRDEILEDVQRIHEETLDRYRKELKQKIELFFLDQGGSTEAN